MPSSKAQSTKRPRRASIFDPEILVVAVTYAVLSELASMAGLFGIPLMILVLCSLWRYCYTLLGAFAVGRPRAPIPDAESANPWGDWGPLLHAFLFMLVIAVLPATRAFGDDAQGLAVRLAITLPFVAFFPASAAIMGVTGNLVAAVNPASIAAVLAVLRFDYVRLIAMLAVLFAVPPMLEQMLGRGGFLGGLAAAAFAMWAQLAAYAAIGRVVNEHGDEFDLQSEFDRREEQDERARDRDWQTVLDRAYGSIRSGLVTQGYHEIRLFAESEGETLQVYQWLFNRMLAWENRQHAAALATRFVDRLIAAGRVHDALELVDHCRRTPDMRLQLAPAVSTLLVEYARSIGRHRSADELATG
jgi:hypothetical protein